MLASPRFYDRLSFSPSTEMRIAWLLLAALPLARAQVELSVDVPGIGSMRCGPSDEPADVVGNFDRAAAKAGLTVPKDILAQAFNHFCSKRACTKTALTLDTGIGSLVVQPWEEPASVVEDFLWQALRAGHALQPQSIAQVIDFFCSRRACTRAMKQEELEITGVGKIVVESWHDPADLVENFLRQAEAGGANINQQSVNQVNMYDTLGLTIPLMLPYVSRSWSISARAVHAGDNSQMLPLK
jgi:hypothetical protein